MRVGTLFTVLATRLTLAVCLFDQPRNWIHPNWQLLPTDSCGQVAPDDGLRPRVLGGVAVDIAEYPWMAYVEDVISNGSNTKSIPCGGSIISDKYILTAAHCFMHKEISSGQFLRKKTNVMLGEHAVSHFSYCVSHRCASPPVKVTADRLYVHPGYTRINPVTGVVCDNDIALVRLAHPITFTDNIRPICLPTAYGKYMQLLAEATYTAAGWGTTTPGGPTSDILMAVKVPVVSNEACEISRTKNLYERHLCPTCRPVISDKQICAGGIQGEGACHGDSGGPLMMSVGLHPTTYFVVGVTSYVVSKAAGGCGSGVPDVYTRVSEYIPWILDTIY